MNEQEKFIVKKYPKLNKEIKQVTDNQLENINYYMKRLEKLHNMAKTNENALKHLKHYYYEKYVIKEKNIKNKTKKDIIQKQKDTLDPLIEYFVNDDNNYPVWAKYWAFQGLIQMFSLNNDEIHYFNRPKKSDKPFIDLNKKALSICIDNMIKYIGNKPVDNEIKQMLKNGSFIRIYTHVLDNLYKDSQKQNNISSEWVKYTQSSDLNKLEENLNEYNINWNVKEDIPSNIKPCNEDIYIYYLYDENSNIKVPKIAIKVENGLVKNIMGTGAYKETELELENILINKLKDFSNGIDTYNQITEDTKTLTTIYEKEKKNIELNSDDILFIYEVIDKISGYGDNKDPRINEIKRKRNKYKDILKIKLPEIFDKNLNFSEFSSVSGLKLPRIMYGDINLSGLQISSGLILPEIMYGNINLKKLIIATGVTFPKEMYGKINLINLKSIKDFEIPYIPLNSINIKKEIKNELKKSRNNNKTR